MNKLVPILKDAAILFAVSTVFVTAVNFCFSFLKKGVPQNSPVVTAILQDDSNTVQTLLKETPAAAGEADSLGRTPLMWVAYANYSDAKRTASEDKTRTALIPLLAQRGADINARDGDGWTPLMWASWSGMPGVVGKLLELGALPNAADKKGNTAVSIAAQRGLTEVVRLLAAKGASSVTTGNRPAL